MSAKQEYINHHSWVRINMVASCLVHMHIITELKAYWLLLWGKTLRWFFAKMCIFAKVLYII